MKKNHLHLIIGIIIVVVSLYLAFRGITLAEMWSALKSANYIYLLPALALVFMSYIFRAMRWRYLVRPVKDVKAFSIFSPLMVGFMANMLPARAGEFIRAYLLSKKEQISFSASFATIVIERLFDLTLVLLLLVWVLLFMPDAFSADVTIGSQSYQLSSMVAGFGMLSLSICIFIFVFAVLLQFRAEWAQKIVQVCVKPLPHKMSEKITGMVHSFTSGLSIMRDRKGFFAVIFYSVLVWGTFILTYYPLYLAFGIEGQLPVLSSIVILCLTVAIFITVLPTPGFLGSFQLGCVAALHNLFGIEQATAFSYGIVAWMVAMGCTVFIGAIFAVKENISFGEAATQMERVE